MTDDQPEKPVIPSPPANTPDEPDRFTAENPDYTGPYAKGRVLHLDFKWFRYGVDDKSHAAALVLSAALLAAALVIAFIGAVQSVFGGEAQWLNTLITWIGNAFLFTAGIAVGQGHKSSRKDNKD